MASHVTPRYVCGDIYMERSAYASCHKFPPNSDSTLETDGKNKGGEKIGRERGWGELEGSRLHARCDKTRQNSFFFPNEKERKLCQKKRRGERGEGGRGRGESVWPFSKVL